MFQFCTFHLSSALHTSTLTLLYGSFIHPLYSKIATFSGNKPRKCFIKNSFIVRKHLGLLPPK